MTTSSVSSLSSKTLQVMFLASDEFPKRHLDSCSRANLCFKEQQATVDNLTLNVHSLKEVPPFWPLLLCGGTGPVCGCVAVWGEGIHEHEHMYIWGPETNRGHR